MKVPLIATKSLKYQTRRLMAGDEFDARNEMDARILTRVRKVAEFPTAKEAPKPTAPVPHIPTTDEVLTAEVVEEPKVEPKAMKAAPKPGAKARKRKAAAKK